MVRTRYSGTAAKAGGKQRKQTSSFGYGSLRPTRKAARSVRKRSTLPHQKPWSMPREARMRDLPARIPPARVQETTASRHPSPRAQGCRPELIEGSVSGVPASIRKRAASVRRPRGRGEFISVERMVRSTAVRPCSSMESISAALLTCSGPSSASRRAISQSAPSSVVGGSDEGKRLELHANGADPP